MSERVGTDTVRRMMTEGDPSKSYSPLEVDLGRDLLDARKERDKALVALGWYFTFGCIHGPIPEEMSPVVAAGFTAYKASLAAARADGEVER